MITENFGKLGSGKAGFFGTTDRGKEIAKLKTERQLLLKLYLIYDKTKNFNMLKKIEQRLDEIANILDK